MIKDRIKLWRLILLFVVMFFIFYNRAFNCISHANEIILIGNRDVPVDSLTAVEIKGIFLGEKVKWDNTRRITFAILKTSAHEDFLKKYIGNTAAQYHNYWRKMVFTGKSRSPRSFKTVEELIEFIANTSGAIGYIPSEALNKRVKVISMQKELTE